MPTQGPPLVQKEALLSLLELTAEEQPRMEQERLALLLEETPPVQMEVVLPPVPSVPLVVRELYQAFVQEPSHPMAQQVYHFPSMTEVQALTEDQVALLEAEVLTAEALVLMAVLACPENRLETRLGNPACR